jgi:GrpB-like predicted nucleotidyltransferase (UPF0157 family)
MTQIERIIGPYEERQANCQDYDPRTAEVARRVGVSIRAHLPGVVVEHIGSTSVPGCAGKGIVDLMVLYPDGQLATARDVLDALGFQRQTNRDPFPEDRPMRTGSLVHDGTTFLLHVHVIAASSPEAEGLCRFRDRLQGDPGLVASYVAAKKAIIAGGVTDPVDYCLRKGHFVEQVLHGGGVNSTSANDLAAAVGTEASKELTSALGKIKHCLDQLSDEQVWRRSWPSLNSIGNLILHLCGNVRQWIVAGLGGARDVRNRPAEFAERGPIPKADLLRQLDTVIGEAKEVLGRLTTRQLLGARRIQGFDVIGLAAIFDSVPHFRGHTQEIVHMTRLQLGDAYKLSWQPTTPEQGAPI